MFDGEYERRQTRWRSSDAIKRIATLLEQVYSSLVFHPTAATEQRVTLCFTPPLLSSPSQPRRSRRTSNVHRSGASVLSCLWEFSVF